MSYSMNCNMNLATVDAKGLLEGIACAIKEYYDSFIAHLTATNTLSFYNDQSDFIKRLMFFDHVGDPQKIRRMMRDWIFYGRKSEWSWKENSVDILMENPDHEAIKARLEDMAKVTGWHATYAIKDMSHEIQKVLEENPILSDVRIDVNLRRTVMKRALENTRYAREEKYLEQYIKNMISSLITPIINDGHGGTYWNVSKMVKGL